MTDKKAANTRSSVGQSGIDKNPARATTQVGRVSLPAVGKSDESAITTDNAAANERLHLSEASQAVSELIRKTLLRSDSVLSEVMQHLTRSQGKNFRASLLLSAAADAEDTVSTDAVTAAAALEILHLATLVHDDVIDEAGLRRGQPSVQSRFGKKIAVIGGDYLFTVCFNLIAGISARYPEKFQLFAQAMSSICLGELRQLKHNGDTELAVTGYLRIIAGKTAALFALAMYSGMILSNAEERESRLVARFGYYIGMLFQLADDCLDYASDSDTIKKTANHDLSEGVITLPLIYTFRQMPELKKTIKEQSLTAEDIAFVVQEVINQGGVARTRSLADRYADKARKLLERLPDLQKRQRLASILGEIQERRF